MHTTRQSSSTRPVTTTAAQRRRRHLAVYYRALRSAETPEQRAGVAKRYRQLFALSQPSATVVDLTSVDSSAVDEVTRSSVRLAS